MDLREDKKISDALLENTEEVTDLKDMVWNNIQRELNLDALKEENMKPKKSRISIITKYGSMAAAVAIILSLNTQLGQAAVGKIKDLFVPNKSITQQLEGTQQQSNVSLEESPMKYIIYVDEEIYTMQHLEGIDKITANTKAENAPEVFMEIQQIKDKKPEIIASELQKELTEKYGKVYNNGTVNNPVKGILIYANSGSEWNSQIVKYYLVDNTKGGTFVIKQQLFLEAFEGHGVRLDNMLKDFKIISEQ
ncbi:MAG: hypothetical protein JJD95_03770 [Clostridium sp.]|nr:hypothetical protein [Clostridium sp.]